MSIFNATIAAKGAYTTLLDRTKSGELIQQWIESALNHVAQHNDTSALNALAQRIVGHGQYKVKKDAMEWPALHDMSPLDAKTKARIAKDWEAITKYIFKVSSIKLDAGSCMFKLPKSWGERKKTMKFEDTWDVRTPKVSAPKIPKKTIDKLNAYVAKLDDRDMAAALQVYISERLEKDMARLASERARRIEEEKKEA